MIFFVILLGVSVEVQATVIGKRTLPYIIQLPENENAIVVEKKSQTFYLFTNKTDDNAPYIHFPCSTGEVGGGKLRAGDKKTPEGIYFIKDEYEDRYLTPVYGERAFPIDYPNFLDTRDGKNGSAIWIHGTNKKLKPMDSNGCITLENENVVLLSDYVTIDSTPVILVEELAYQDKDRLNTQKKEINRVLKKWTAAIKSGTYQQYLAFYSPSYLPEIGFWRDWIKIRETLAGNNSIWGIQNESVGIYYHEAVFVVLFKQVVQLGDKRIPIGTRKLFLSEREGDYTIVGDVYQALPDTVNKNADPLIAAMEEVVMEPHLVEKQVLDTVQSWLTAWSAKEMDTYASFYADNFYSDGMNKKQWVKRKKRISRKYAYISVKGKGFDIRQDNNICNVNFLQMYESSGFSAKGRKQLKLIKVGGSWKIFRENWKKK